MFVESVGMDERWEKTGKSRVRRSEDSRSYVVLPLAVLFSIAASLYSYPIPALIIFTRSLLRFDFDQHKNIPSHSVGECALVRWQRYSFHLLWEGFVHVITRFHVGYKRTVHCAWNQKSRNCELFNFFHHYLWTEKFGWSPIILCFVFVSYMKTVLGYLSTLQYLHAGMHDILLLMFLR